MAICRIEWFKPIPEHSFHSSDEVIPDLDKYLEKGWMEANLLGIGKKPNVLPKRMARAFRGATLPMMVNFDGSGLLALRKDLSALKQGAQEPHVYDLHIGSDAIELRQILGDEDNPDLYRMIGMPGQFQAIPFSAKFPGERFPFRHGMLLHANGGSPLIDTPLRTAGDILRVIGE